VRKADLKPDSTVINHNVVTGRVQRLAIQENDETLVLWNAHNENLTQTQSGNATDLLRRDIDEANVDPVKH
jgi:hypothetical protein